MSPCIFFSEISRTVGVALTNGNLDWQSLLSAPVPPNSPDLQMSTVVELWPSEQSNSIQTTSGHLVNPQGRKARGDCFRLDVMAQGFSPSVKKYFSCKWVEIIWLNRNIYLWVFYLSCFRHVVSAVKHFSVEQLISSCAGSTALFCPLLDICGYWAVPALACEPDIFWIFCKTV